MQSDEPGAHPDSPHYAVRPGSSPNSSSSPYVMSKGKKKPPFNSISFAGCGGMYPYVLGIACYLQEEFDLSGVTFYASSGGTLSAFLLAAGLDVRQFQNTCNLPGLEECRQTTWLGAAFNGFAIASRWLLAWLPEDAFERTKGRLFLSATQLPTFHNRLLCDFDSNEDCVQAMKCSSFIPWVFELFPACQHRGSWYVDGGLSSFQPKQDKDTFCVYFYRWRQVMPHWLWPYCDVEWTKKIFEWGCEDAKQHFEGTSRKDV